MNNYHKNTLLTFFLALALIKIIENLNNFIIKFVCGKEMNLYTKY